MSTNPTADELRERGVDLKHFDDAYEGPPPPWDIGHAQPEIVRVADAGVISGRVLDVGCGTGENAVFLAQRGCTVLGVDAAERAIAKANTKIKGLGDRLAFRVHDALNLQTIGKRFDTIIDSGLFHVFSDVDRARFVESLASALEPGGRFVLLCFSDAETREKGPRRVTKAEIEDAFRNGWTVESIDPMRFEVREELYPDGARGWCAVIQKR